MTGYLSLCGCHWFQGMSLASGLTRGSRVTLWVSPCLRGWAIKKEDRSLLSELVRCDCDSLWSPGS